MSKINDKLKDVSDYFGVIEPFGEFYLTKYGSLIAAIELTGFDPDGHDADSRLVMSFVAAGIYSNLDKNINITQYHSHFDGAKVRMRKRNDPRHNLLSKRREAFLNEKNLSYSSIVHYIELEPDEDLNRLGALNTFMHLGRAVFDKRSRIILSSALNIEKAHLQEEKLLERMSNQLKATVLDILAKWNGICGSRLLSKQEVWAHMRFLASFQSAALSDGFTEPVPDENLDIYLAQGDINLRQVLSKAGGSFDALKLAGSMTTFCKFAAVRGFTIPGGKVVPGLWAASPAAPTRQTGNFIAMIRWKPYTHMQRAWLFKDKALKLERSNISILSMLSGGDQASILEKQAAMSESIKRKLEELSLAEDARDVDGIGHAFIAVFDEDPSKLYDSMLRQRTAAASVGLNLVWESVGNPEAFRAFQPGQRGHSVRNLHMSAAQFGAASMMYQSSIGQPIVKDLGMPETNFEEAQYVLTSVDRTAFHYSPYVSGRALSICVGPIGSGKTFLKNSLATHVPKYGGLYSAVDIDAGTESLAQSFGDDAGIFKVGLNETRGFNFFGSVPEGSEEGHVIAHLNSQLHQFLQANDTPEMRSITAREQADLDTALIRTLRLTGDSRRQLRTLSGLVGHLQPDLQAKFGRWVRNLDGRGGNDGFHSYLFDNVDDPVRGFDKPISVFNMAALRDNKAALIPALNEIFFRTVNAFEHPDLRGRPKWLDIDEAHYLLSIPAASNLIVQKVRTWRKHYAGIALWTQSPEELALTHNWSAVLSAASTFWFMANPSMDEKVYRTTFPFLTAGQLSAIRDLIPQKQAYIIQRDIGVSKVVLLETEIEQYVINTSHPREAALRDSLFKEYGFETGLERAVEAIRSIKGVDGQAEALRNSPLLRVVNSSGVTA
jgi:type IV secretion system protein VirB4